MQDELLNTLLKKDDIGWQSLIHELVKSEKMDPWDIDISLLSQRYLEIVKQMQQMDFLVSGKVVLATAILLKMKSNKLLNENIANFDSNLFQSEEIPEEHYEELEEYSQERLTQPKLTIRTPQSRKKKVSIIDLVSALEKALEVEKKRKIRNVPYEVPEHIRIPERKIDISERIKNIYQSVLDFFSNKENENLKFSQLTPSESKEDIISTFLPVLHLENEKKVNIFQSEPFEDFNIQLKEVKNERTKEN